MFKLVAEGVPTTKEQYQLALDCAFAAGKASYMPPKPVGFLEVLADRLSKLSIEDRKVIVDHLNYALIGLESRSPVSLQLSMSSKAQEVLRQCFYDQRA